jgi:ribosome biogenesis GTPase
MCSLHQLGWRSCYAHGLTLADFEVGYPARVVTVRHDRLSVLSSRGPGTTRWPLRPVGAIAGGVAAGDWLLLEQRSGCVLRLLARQSLLGGALAANLDTLFVVTACGGDFSVARLQRYLALAFEARVTPVVVMTKADRCVDAPAWLATAQRLLPDARVLLVNVDERGSAARLEPWLAEGSTVALVGPAGAGKDNLMRHWLDDAADAPAGRGAPAGPAGMPPSMRPLRTGAWVIDTPGLRGLCDVMAMPSGGGASSRVVSRGARR